MTNSTPSPRILLVDDQPQNLRLLERILSSGGYQDVQGISESNRVMTVCKEYEPDLILLDIHMPPPDGIAVMAQLHQRYGSRYLPVLALTGDGDIETKRSALRAGANDLLTKPFDIDEVLLRVKNLLQTRHLYLQVEEHLVALEDKVRERTAQLAGAQAELLERLGRAAEFHDDDTEEHRRRVGEIAAGIAHAMGEPEAEVALLRLAAPLHDVGKVGLPDRVLVKTGELTAEERQIIQSHTSIGGELLGRSKFPVLQLAREIAVSHHERWDGMGYPQGLKGDRISLAARIVAVADTFDVLTHDRPFQKRRPPEEALAEIKRQSGRQFDPSVVDTLVKMLHREGSSRFWQRLEETARIAAE
jgi:putative two-component system response regulator